MAGAFWCIVEDDRQGNPKKVMAEVLGEAARLAGLMGSQAEAVWLTDKATPEGLKLLAELGAKRVWLFESAAFSPYRGEVWTPVLAELAGKEAPQAILGAVTLVLGQSPFGHGSTAGPGLVAWAAGIYALLGIAAGRVPVLARLSSLERRRVVLGPSFAGVA